MVPKEHMLRILKLKLPRPGENPNHFGRSRHLVIAVHVAISFVLAFAASCLALPL